MESTPDAISDAGDDELAQPLRDRGATTPNDRAEEIPAEDLQGSQSQPESQGEDPVIAELGEEGEGDLSPEDV